MKERIRKIWKATVERAGKLKRQIAGTFQRLTVRIRKWPVTQRFLAHAGYYTALATLLVVLGLASHAYRNQQTEPAEAAPTLQPQAAAAMVTPAPSPTMTPEPTAEPAKYVWPVSGEVIAAFAPDELIWSDTLSQWQTHPAIDIAGAAGETVVACADGTVIDAYFDSLWGNVIVIEHADGLISTYANLNTLNLVSVGQTVACGETISAIGQSAAGEVEMPWHLHFALSRDGEPVDFVEFMQKGF